MSMDIKTKFNAMIAVILLILAGGLIAGVIGDIYMTDTEMGYSERIVCSNGNTYPATAAYLQTAINSLNGTGGWIDYPPVRTTTTSTIKVRNNVSLDMHFAEIVPTGDFNTFELHNKTLLQNVVINQSANSAFSNTSACIYPYGYIGDGDGEYYGEGFDFIKRRTVRNIAMIGQKDGANKQKGIGIYLHPTANTDDYANDLYENIKFKFLNTSIKIIVDTAGTYCNVNEFNYITGVGCSYFIYLSATKETITMNTFNNIFYEAESITNEHYPIYLNKNCDFNRFKGTIMDWVAQGDTTPYIYVNDSACDQNVFDIYVGFDAQTGGRIVDKGDRSTFYTEFHTKQNDINLTTLNKYDIDTSGVKFYSSTTGNPYTYFYGYDTGTSSVKSGLLRVESTGRFWIASDTGEDIKLSPSQGDNTKNVTIDDILKLDGRTTHPTGATEGMIYYNTTTNLIMLYTTAWHSLDIT